MDIDNNNKRLITSALPYVNNVPHLGNLIQVLSADVFARFCRSRGYETLYVCGTDEYGTATETRAREQNITPQELCDTFFVIHRDIYQWFNINFDVFGRTSTPQQTEIVQSIFKKMYKAGYITTHTEKQLYSETANMFLADRYVKGICPKCGYEDARGDQCEHCGSLLDSLDLIHPKSAIDDSTPVVKETTHLYIDLPKILPKLQHWMDYAKVAGKWSKNAVKMTEAWIRDGLKSRAITRDLQWGIPVPLDGFENKVFYVWFDAPIGYISITATHTDDWKQWWKNPDDVALFQFVGKDNIPFHTVLFPSTQLASGEQWTMLYRMSSSEYLNYEGGMFSKSRGIGIFGNDAMNTGIPADVWRFYLFYNRPESSDYMFSWKDFQEAVNGELINNLANLYNRTLSFISKYHEGNVQVLDSDDDATKNVWNRILVMEEEITELLEGTELRQAYHKIFILSSMGNKLFQDYEPWKLRIDNPEKTRWLLGNLVYLLRDLAILIAPYTPDMSYKILQGLCVTNTTDWNMLGTLKGITHVHPPVLLFTRLENTDIEQFKEQFSGSQAEREEQADRQHQDTQNNTLLQQKKTEHYSETLPLYEQFAKKVKLQICKIKDVQPHPNADKLYVLSLDDGTIEGRTIVSGLRMHYSEEDLLKKRIIVVSNLKSAKFRGIVSNGMLLAASCTDSNGYEMIEVLFVNDVAVGTQVLPQNTVAAEEYGTLKVDVFFDMPINVLQHNVVVGTMPLVIGGTVIQTSTIAEGSVG